MTSDQPQRSVWVKTSMWGQKPVGSNSGSWNGHLTFELHKYLFALFGKCFWQISFVRIWVLLLNWLQSITSSNVVKHLLLCWKLGREKSWKRTQTPPHFFLQVFYSSILTNGPFLHWASVVSSFTSEHVVWHHRQVDLCNKLWRRLWLELLLVQQWELC